MQLRIPGPTPLPDEVLAAMHRDMISHREGEFRDLLLDVTDMLKAAFQTHNDLLVFPGAGTGGLEASIVNLFSPGDTVVALPVGSFGARYADIAERFGLRVVRVPSAWGEPVDLAALQRAIEAGPGTGISGVLVTHNETSTGVQNDVEAIGQVMRDVAGKPGKLGKTPTPLLLVDCISSMGAVDIPVDLWGIDVAITASQKAWMAPPGLTMLSISPRAWAAHDVATLPRYYWDFAEARRYLQRGETPYTPAISLLFGLQASLRLIMAEGLPNVFARHERIRDQVRAAARRIGLEPFAPDGAASRTVTALRAPEGRTASQIVAAMLEGDIVIAGGQEAYKEKLIRIGHMGMVSERDIDDVMAALERVVGAMQAA